MFASDWSSGNRKRIGQWLWVSKVNTTQDGVHCVIPRVLFSSTDPLFVTHHRCLLDTVSSVQMTCRAGGMHGQESVQYQRPAEKFRWRNSDIQFPAADLQRTAYSTSCSRYPGWAVARSFFDIFVKDRDHIDRFLNHIPETEAYQSNQSEVEAFKIRFAKIWVSISFLLIFHRPLNVVHTVTGRDSTSNFGT